MFKAKRIDSGEIQTILAVEFNIEFHQTYFLVWDNYGWRWRPAHKYCPPNVEPKDINPVESRTIIKETGEIIEEEKLPF